MFKNLILYWISQPWPTDLSTIEQALAAVPFIECGAAQEKSSGWVPPRGEAVGAWHTRSAFCAHRQGGAA